jgi:hypothetical protein
VRLNQPANSHSHSPWSYYSYLSLLLGKSLTCGTPLRSSQELIKPPFCPVEQDLTEGWLSQGCGEGLPSPDETARWVDLLLLEVQVGSRWLRGLELHGEEGPRIPSVGTPPCLVLSSSLLWCSSATNWWLKGPEWLVSEASRNIGEILSDEKPSSTQRNGELMFYFMPAALVELPLEILGAQTKNSQDT